MRQPLVQRKFLGKAGLRQAGAAPTCTITIATLSKDGNNPRAGAHDHIGQHRRMATMAQLFVQRTFLGKAGLGQARVAPMCTITLVTLREDGDNPKLGAHDKVAQSSVSDIPLGSTPAQPRRKATMTQYIVQPRRPPCMITCVPTTPPTTIILITRPFVHP